MIRRDAFPPWRTREWGLNWRVHLSGLQHVVDDVGELGGKAIRLKVDHLDDAGAHCFPGLGLLVGRQGEEALQVSAPHTDSS